MTNLKDLRYSAISYKIKHNALPNFKIKVKLSKVTSTFQLEDNYNAVNYSETHIFDWQEKVFSPLERVLYSQPYTNPTTIQKKYIQDVKQLRDKGAFPTKRLFSYINHDDYVHHNRSFTTQDPNTTSYIGKLVDDVKHIRLGSKEVWKGGMKMNPIIEDMADDQLLSRHMPHSSSQQMFIMADLSFPVSSTTSDDKENTMVSSLSWSPQEVVLCRISVDEYGCCVVQPDFSKTGDAQYIVENPATKENFEYTILNVSNSIPSIEKDKEVKLLKEIYARSVGKILSLVGPTFDDQIPDNSLRLFVAGEIVSAYDFEHQNIYVQYFVDVPEDWTVTELDQLTGITQLSRGKITDSGYLCHFSFPFEVNMLYQKNIYKGPQQTDEIPSWPVIFIEVFSIDSWSRYRTEGYGYSQLPLNPGMYQLNLSCWRPISDSITNELRRFFVGGSAELEDLTFASVPDTFDGNLLSKYGFRTMSTGNVILRLNCLQQSNSFIDEKLNRSDGRHLVDRMGGSNVHFGVMEVINAFRRVRERLIHIREGDNTINLI